MDTDELRKAASYIFSAMDIRDKNKAELISGKLNHAVYEIDKLRDAIILALDAPTLDEVKDILNKVV